MQIGTGCNKINLEAGKGLWKDCGRTGLLSKSFAPFLPTCSRQVRWLIGHHHHLLLLLARLIRPFIVPFMQCGSKDRGRERPCCCEISTGNSFPSFPSSFSIADRPIHDTKSKVVPDLRPNYYYSSLFVGRFRRNNPYTENDRGNAAKGKKDTDRKEMWSLSRILNGTNSFPCR